ncbi:MAG: hypothetical protein M1823_006453 [Watsoniomyces obsoletus]|nr:MAG: hypothetical protein M1823_006453 [Watsoniomyces obsoletus]
MSAGGPRTRSQTAAVEDRGRNRSPSAVPSGDDNNPPTPRDEMPPNDTAGPRIDPGCYGPSSSNRTIGLAG